MQPKRGVGRCTLWPDRPSLPPAIWKLRWRIQARANGSNPPNGLPANSASPMSSSSTAHIISPRRNATPRRNILPRIFQARCSSTSTPSPIRRPTCRTCCRGRTNSARRSARSALPRPTPSSSMTAAGFIRRRGCGGPSAFSAPKMFSSSTAAFRPGRPKAAPLEAGEVKPTPQNVQGRDGHRRGRHGRRRADGAQRRRRASGRCALGRALCRQEPEPRTGLRSGHMPGAFNVPFTEIVENGRLASPDKIAQAFKKAGVDTDKPVITSCGSGVTAAVLALGLDALGKPLPRFMTAPGRNGAARPICRWKRTRSADIAAPCLLYINCCM